jgi:hypothetical protein
VRKGILLIEKQKLKAEHRGNKYGNTMSMRCRNDSVNKKTPELRECILPPRSFNSTK